MLLLVYAKKWSCECLILIRAMNSSNVYVLVLLFSYHVLYSISKFFIRRNPHLERGLYFPYLDRCFKCRLFSYVSRFANRKDFCLSIFQISNSNFRFLNVKQQSLYCWLSMYVYLILLSPEIDDSRFNLILLILWASFGKKIKVCYR